jgi:hypothetical protein
LNPRASRFTGEREIVHSRSMVMVTSTAAPSSSS